MQTRLIRYFLALEQEGHFGRAAAACNVSQPTLSAGIAALENQRGKRLILRERKYQGLTLDGAKILPWARQVVAAAEGMLQAAHTAKGDLLGEARLGCIPAAMPAVGALGAALIKRFPKVTLSIRSSTSRQIERELLTFEIDAGITYLDFEPPARVLTVALYAERYMLVAARSSGLAEGRRLTWRDVADLPLCLLPPSMQNRRILDARLAAVGLALRPRVTAESYVALLSLVQQGQICSIIPDSHVSLLDGLDWIVRVPLGEQEESSPIGLVVPDRSPLNPLSKALLAIANGLKAADCMGE